MHLFLKCIFWNKTLHVSDSSSIHHKEFLTVHTTMVYVIQVCCVQWKTPDDGQRNCPKHVEFYSKNKLDKLMHLVGFIIRIFQDARSLERQKAFVLSQNTRKYVTKCYK